MNNIYLVGFMGVGKSTVGKRLASKLRLDFVDTDVIFEKKYKLSIDAFFSKYGEELFRKLENDILESTFTLNNCVIATGGGLPCYFDAMYSINKNDLSVYIKMSDESILSRLINSKQKRPLVMNMTEDELLNYIRDRLAKRNPDYSKAKITVQGLSVNIDLLASKIMSYIKN